MSERDYSAGIGDVKRLMVRRPGRAVEQRSQRVWLQWTPRMAIVAVIASVLFTWAFLHVIVSYLFAADQVRH